MKKSARRQARTRKVISLDEVRNRLRLVAYQTKISNIVLSNRQALTQLHNTGAMFSFHGARASRDLLLAHQHLLRVVTLLNRVVRGADGKTKASSEETLFQQLDALLEKTQHLTHRTATYLARLRKE